MNIIKQNLMAEKSVYAKNSQALIEGVLKLPETMEEITTVLMIEGLACIKNCETGPERATVEGDAKYSVIYIDKKGEVKSFDSQCNFKHSVPIPGITADMHAVASVRVQDTTFKSTDSNGIDIKSVLSVDVYAVQNEQYEILDKIDGMNDLETKQYTEYLPCFESAKSVKSYIKTDIRVPQSMPAAKEVLLCKAYPIIRSINTESEKIIVEGDVRINIVYLSSDKNAPVQFLNDTIPFGEIINDPKCQEKCNVHVFSDIQDILATCNIENNDIINLSGIVGLKTMCYKNIKTSYIEDLYAKQRLIEPHTACINVINKKYLGVQKKLMNCPISIPTHAPDVSRVLFATANPQILKAKPSADRVYIEGVLGVNMCYFTGDAMIKSIKLDIPFDTEIQMDGIKGGVELIPNVEHITVTGTGKELDSKVCLEVAVIVKSDKTVRAVQDVEQKEDKETRPCGIVIYFADEGDTLWDIAKKFRVSKNALLKLNPDIKDGKIKKGTKLMLIS